MNHFEDYDFNGSNDFLSDQNPELLSHQKQVKKMLEEKLERKRLKEEFNELDGEFDWNDL